MKKAIFLDRDGTINVEKNYLYKVEDLEFEKGAIDALKTFKKLGYILIVITNQSGIARNYFSEEDLYKFNEAMNSVLKENESEISKFYFCPHHPKEGIGIYKKECKCRKPNNALIEQAIKEYEIDRAESYMIGDKVSDIEAGAKSGLKTVLVKTGYGKKEFEKIRTTETLICDNLLEFSEILKRKKLSELIKEEFNRDIFIENIAMDSRKVSKNSLFFAINKGNKFIGEAMKKGASLIVADNTDICDDRIINVKNTIETMQNLAKKYREKLALKVIGITGSNGKTTTKDIVHSILSQQYSVLKTEGNYNNHIGLPFTILNLTVENEVAVLEMGMSDFGEIKKLCEIARPDYGIITNVGESHLEYLKTRENVFKAKTEMLDFVKKENLFVFGDDDFLEKIEAVKVGFKKNNDVQIDEFSFSENESRFTINSQQYLSNLLGKHNVINAAIAVGLCEKMGLENSKIKKGLERIKVSEMRFQEIKIDDDIYINDAYNASPTSMKAAIDTIASIYNDRYKIAVLGDILEIGVDEINYHIEILKYILDKNIKTIYLYGERMKKAYDKLFNLCREERIKYFEEKEEIVKSLNRIKERKVILLKASRGMKLEEIIEIKKGKVE
ncbi:MAG: D-glycero-beta-D-manno-heptose 1,7-bisphosphate 7-phosphatase [Fusobacterium sp.]|uniref:D-glycero-beta-D-manno-heptose 1,7-bisphosphate 7-phosphatase n=1 Tax=Fusobacterium sp. TaxID=68766 RepID=UPI0026DAADCA|nr:D-glycero-beta-D-manno-heptose 1,7-bisphosphate 7-phosphatase [Fusobacterium sp.]MDO4691177.1 D-glycero-beta-D-manno-heptose 1,7-bisphosphate 7-phosphatase [Fusobacterium sp.]